MFRKLLILQFLLLAAPAFAHTYLARVDEAEWHLDPSPLKCRLWQSVPNYGDAVFEVGVGKTLQFHFEAYRPIVNGGKGKLSIEGPEWRTDVEPRAVGDVSVVPGKRPISLGRDQSNMLLDQLAIGLYPTFRHADWNKGHDITVEVSPVNFQSAYTGYVSCVAGLYPVDYPQVRQSLLHFATDKWHIRGKLKQRLDLVAGYILLDPNIDQVFIAGHADSVGRRGYNWELSRKRAKAVKDYLEAKGVPPNLIKMTYYGEGKPVKPNSTVKGKAANPRVLIQLDRT